VLLKHLQKLLAPFKDLHIVFTAMNGAEAVEKMAFYADKVDLLLMDIEMPEMNGIEATRILREKYPKVAIVMLTVFEHEAHLLEAMQAGAAGYLLKDEPGPQIRAGVLQAMEGRLPLSPTMALKAVSRLGASAPDRSEKARLAAFGLTTREREVYAGLVEARTYTQIAETLFISPKTVRRHMENLYKKLKVNSKAEAIVLAHENNWFG
ncbi:MAG: response regulator transcription factor, partial [Bacteroidota bacterium]